MEFPESFIYAGPAFSAPEQPVPAPYFRRQFRLERVPEQAELLICGIGFYELYVNGQRITRGRLAPYISSPDVAVYYDSYDITPLLKIGENVLGVWLGNGFQNNPGGYVWDFDKARYTNSVKGVKGIWADFLADAGAKFTPVLTTFFNTIIDSWPTIEPMLMQLVDLLADGLSQAIPILVQLGSQLLPVFCDALALIFQVMQPLIPVIGNLAATLLPPLASILSMLVGALLPPLTTILNVVCNDILVPLMPIISTIASAILPPIAQLLGVVAPLLQAIAPILQVIGQILTVVADVIGTIIGWVADGVGAVVNFFDKLFGGAKEAQGGMEDLAESTNSVASSIPDIGTIEMPAVEIPDTSAYTGAIQSAMDTAPIMAEESWGAAKETATSGLEEIGTSANDTYGAMAAQAESAWDRMKTAAASAVSATITELQKLKNAINSVGSITISTGSVTSTPVQGHASGTNDFGGGLTRINEQGGEMAILPSGSQIIPADQTENIINTSRHSKSVTFAPQISVTMSGNASDEEKEQTKAWFLQMCRDAYRQMQNEDTNIEALQASLA